MAIRLLIAMFLAAVLAPLASAQTAIRLRASAPTIPGAAVRLSDVATLTGPEAERLGTIVIVALGTGRGEVTVSDVRTALSGAGVNWGQVTLGGRACVLTAEAAPARSKDPAPKEERARPEVVDCSLPATVRSMIAQRLATNLNVTPEQLRLKFTAAGETDPALLDRAIESGERTDVQAAATGPAGRVPVRVTVLNDERVLASGTMNVDVLVERPCVMLTESVERERVLTADLLVVQTQWLAPSAPVPLAMDEVLSRQAARRLRPGEALGRTDVQSPMLIRKGDEVIVQCFTGSISIETRAFAQNDARLDETVTLALDKSKGRKPFTARATAPGRAVRIDPAAAALPSAMPETPARSATPRASRR